MYSQCPECHARFRVTAAALRVARGTVRCGRCGSAFDALPHLSDALPDQALAAGNLADALPDLDAPDAIEDADVRSGKVVTEFHFSADDIEKAFVDERDWDRDFVEAEPDDAASLLESEDGTREPAAGSPDLGRAQAVGAGGPQLVVDEPDAIEDITLEGERIHIEGLTGFDDEEEEEEDVEPPAAEPEAPANDNDAPVAADDANDADRADAPVAANDAQTRDIVDDGDDDPDGDTMHDIDVGQLRRDFASQTDLDSTDRFEVLSDVPDSAYPDDEDDDEPDVASPAPAPRQAESPAPRQAEPRGFVERTSAHAPGSDGSEPHGTDADTADVGKHATGHATPVPKVTPLSPPNAPPVRVPDVDKPASPPVPGVRAGEVAEHTSAHDADKAGPGLRPRSALHPSTFDRPDFGPRTIAPSVPPTPRPSPVKYVAPPAEDDDQPDEVYLPVEPVTGDWQDVEAPPPVAGTTPIHIEPPVLSRKPGPDDFFFVVNDPDAVNIRGGRRATLLWGLGALVLGIALVVQLTHHFRQDLARDPNVGPALRETYERLGTPLAPTWDLSAFRLQQWGAAEATPTADGMTVRASLRNGAAFAQPLPLLRLEFEDRFGGTVARRDFTPKEYLRDPAQATRMLPAGAAAEAELAIVDIATDAVGYRLDVCLPGAGAHNEVLCAQQQTQARTEPQ